MYKFPQIVIRRLLLTNIISGNWWRNKLSVNPYGNPLQCTCEKHFHSLQSQVVVVIVVVSATHHHRHLWFDYWLFYFILSSTTDFMVLAITSEWDPIVIFQFVIHLTINKLRLHSIKGNLQSLVNLIKLAITRQVVFSSVNMLWGGALRNIVLESSTLESEKPQSSKQSRIRLSGGKWKRVEPAELSFPRMLISRTRIFVIVKNFPSSLFFCADHP